MSRPYKQTSRADSKARTRAAIIDAAQRLCRQNGDFKMEEVVRESGVSIQTIYSHFSSKRGLLMAVVDAVQRDAGLYKSFTRVWKSPDGETAMKRMIEATLHLWDGAWPYIASILKARRIDEEFEQEFREVDRMRRRDLLAICKRLRVEGRLRSPRSPDRAADVLFALSGPAVYEDLVQKGNLTLSQAITEVTRIASGALIDDTVKSSLKEPPDWKALAPSANPEWRPA
jgi:AcrR family transcriptional regulator